MLSVSIVVLVSRAYFFVCCFVFMSCVGKQAYCMEYCVIKNLKIRKNASMSPLLCQAAFESTGNFRPKATAW